MWPTPSPAPDAAQVTKADTEAILSTFNGTNADDYFFGGAGNDQLRGGPGDDTLIGGPGSDLIDGGDGVDLTSYASGPHGMFADLSLTSPQPTSEDSSDTLINIENLKGSLYDDTLSGNVGANAIYGGGGPDIISDPGGANYLRGEDGDDRITGGAGFDDANGNMGADTVSTGAGDDYAVGGKDSDSLSGGTGGDVVSSPHHVRAATAAMSATAPARSRQRRTPATGLLSASLATLSTSR